eukprot:TRINITY_DN17798_c0_g1_i7.p1 TRINITY_DN17798_c0_g1~~TRINITY_DN17798_c0_g1_i7.p1  ORF type:complete len:239 (-),score=59.35 TRINITY_DN17798_c0_g1_i7:431-1147(-)
MCIRDRCRDGLQSEARVRDQSNDYVSKTVRTHEILYTWLLLDQHVGKRVERVIAMENDVHFTSKAGMTRIFDRFMTSGVDYLYQETMNLNSRSCGWCFMQYEPAILPEASAALRSSKSKIGFTGMLNLFGLSRKLLDTMADWVVLNGGELTFDEVLLGTLSIRHGLETTCWQHWLGGDLWRRKDFMRWRPCWSWIEMDWRMEEPGVQSPLGSIFHPVKDQGSSCTASGATEMKRLGLL